MNRWPGHVLPTVCCMMALSAHGIRAQGILTGLVRDSAGHPIVGAEVAVEALGRVSHTKDDGHYSIAGITPGMRIVRVRRVGYSPFSLMVSVSNGENKQGDVVLGRVVTKLDTVLTRDQMLYHEDPSLREFDENRKLGLGHFVTRADLEKLEGRPLDQALAQLPGIEVVHAGVGGAAYIRTKRGTQSIENNECPRFEDKRPNAAGCTDCYPPVYLDNTPPSPGMVVNINRFAPAQVEAIEIYAGPAQTPPKYGGLNSHCGVIVIHTRRPP